MLPPLAAALMKFTLGVRILLAHARPPGGTAFLKSPVGRIFFDYFGENLLRSDLSISVGSLGSLLDHTGPDRRARAYCARVFGAHRTLLRDQRHLDVEPRDLHGGRGARPDRAVRPQLPQVDRAQPGDDRRHPARTSCRCATATESSARFRPSASPRRRIKAGDQGQPAGDEGHRTRARCIPVVTNSTYDGLCYNARRVEELLDPSVDRIHFDEAWYAYARFNPLYRDRHAMHGDPKDHKGPTIFATHSTHKLLAALSQASFLHIRDGRSPIPHSRFNESYMLHASTSPLYPIIVSNDITAAMMDGPGGPALTGESIAGGGRVPPDHGTRAPRVRARRRTGSSRPGTRTPSRTRSRQEGALRGRAARAARHRSGLLGAASAARPGTASAISKTTTACSTRSRCRS